MNRRELISSAIALATVAVTPALAADGEKYYTAYRQPDHTFEVRKTTFSCGHYESSGRAISDPEGPHYVKVVSRTRSSEKCSGCKNPSKFLSS